MKPVENVTLTIGQWNEIQAREIRMMEALSFYANGNNYDDVNGTDMHTSIESDYGNKARKALGIHND